MVGLKIDKLEFFIKIICAIIYLQKKKQVYWFLGETTKHTPASGVKLLFTYSNVFVLNFSRKLCNTNSLAKDIFPEKKNKINLKD